MANKNTAGNTLAKAKAKEERLVRMIDRRENNGKNMENVDTSFSNYRMTDSGERVWSY